MRGAPGVDAELGEEPLIPDRRRRAHQQAAEEDAALVRFTPEQECVAAEASCLVPKPRNELGACGPLASGADGQRRDDEVRGGRPLGKHEDVLGPGGFPLLWIEVIDRDRDTVECQRGGEHESGGGSCVHRRDSRCTSEA